MKTARGAKVSRNVTAIRCAGCPRKFKPKRRDAKYCSGACRQRCARARAVLADIDREIEVVRLRYWSLVARKAAGQGVPESTVLTGQAQLVKEDGSVYMGGRLVGKTTPPRPGWTLWGLEAAGPPFSPPP